MDQLTPEQQAALDQAAARFAREGARRQVEEVKAEARAEAQEAARLAAQQARDEARAEANEEARRKKAAGAGLAAREDDEVIHTRILGRFKGWEGHTVFRLENGQVWQQSNPDLKFFPDLVDPDIDLVPHGWAGWRLVVVKEGLWCKVKRIQ